MKTIQYLFLWCGIHCVTTVGCVAPRPVTVVHIEDRGGHGIPNATIKIWLSPFGVRGELSGPPAVFQTDSNGNAQVHLDRHLNIQLVEFTAEGYRLRRGALQRCVTLVRYVENSDFENVWDATTVRDYWLKRLCINVVDLEEIANLAIKLLPVRDSVVPILKSWCPDANSRPFALAFLRLVGDQQAIESASRWAHAPRVWLLQSKSQLFIIEGEDENDCLDRWPSDEDSQMAADGFVRRYHDSAFAGKRSAAESSEELIDYFRQALRKDYESTVIERSAISSDGTCRLVTVVASTTAADTRRFLLRLDFDGRLWRPSGVWLIASVIP